jgi:hypothetical protein
MREGIPAGIGIGFGIAIDGFEPIERSTRIPSTDPDKDTDECEREFPPVSVSVSVSQSMASNQLNTRPGYRYR